MKTFEILYLWAQVAFSFCVIMFGMANAVRGFIIQCDAMQIMLFAGIAYVGYKFMLCTSIDELRKARKSAKGGKS